MGLYPADPTTFIQNNWSHIIIHCGGHHQTNIKLATIETKSSESLVSGQSGQHSPAEGGLRRPGGERDGREEGPTVCARIASRVSSAAATPLLTLPLVTWIRRRLQATATSAQRSPQCAGARARPLAFTTIQLNGALLLLDTHR